MVVNPVTLTRKSPLLYRFVGFSRTTTSQFGQQIRIPANQVQISAFRACSSHSFRSYPLNSGHGTGFKDVFNSKTGLAHRSLNPARFSAVSDGGSGGSGGTGGGSGDASSGGGSSAGGSGGSNWSFFSWYLALLAKYPMLTKAVTSALLTFIGDIVCQVVIDQAPSLDVKRTFVFTLLGLVLVGPTLHFWYLNLSKLVPLPGVSGTLVRLLLDQLLFAPTFIGVFLSTLVTLEGRPSQVVPKLQQEWFSAVLANWKLWIPFQFLNFLFVPQQFQVLAANFVSLAWNVILSFKAHKEILLK
ncbi:hypothetical protein Ddye_012043 [Dipteronia dyeriana]|uniref:Uncharacterized protein n=1 Tax=Dipteronia dyeriana TaxID=168575 RepID=A0AAD9X3P9_9ROSI|nr:hypothetical protein Ddye_012043 [Dipteronia dyeriana]